MTRTPIADYAGLRRAIDARRKELGYSHLEFDHVAGLCDGYFGKIACGMRSLGEMSLPVVLDALGLELAVEPDPQALPPEIARHLPVDQRPQHAEQWITL